MVCNDCVGTGQKERCQAGHTGNCPCSASLWECGTCSGSGRLCDTCGAALSVCLPKDQTKCHDCASVHPCAGGCGLILRAAEAICGYCIGAGVVELGVSDAG